MDSRLAVVVYSEEGNIQKKVYIKHRVFQLNRYFAITQTHIPFLASATALIKFWKPRLLCDVRRALPWSGCLLCRSCISIKRSLTTRMEGRPKQRAETFYRKDEDSETAKIQMEDGEIRPDNKTGSLQSSASNRRTDLEPNHHIIKYMPVEVPVHDQYMPEFSDQFPGLNHQDSQELLSRGGTCFDPPLFTCVSPFSIPELTFCQTRSNCAILFTAPATGLTAQAVRLTSWMRMISLWRTRTSFLF
ncbi:uncharacterized protein LOC124398082 isoform X2 [Silurus meridionalis]|uniref:uncharacterized protein LOC124398082 isoform X2 n=1 Tax=Silurus meridionalis TaxID=175797 RepID=UPI001EEC9A58|nr:uncharacterized protein LOC124398082 isoform X2 [Silurus meridionalis]